MATTFERFGAMDSVFLSCESDTHPMHIGAVCVFDPIDSGAPPLSIAKLRQHVESRLGRCPRYRQRVAYVPLEGHPVWVDAEKFRIEDHVRAVALPAPQSRDRLEETVAWILSQPLCRARPLWEVSLIEGLDRGAAALVCKVHHCMADGLSGVALFTSIFGLEPFSQAQTAAAWSPRPRPGGVNLLADAVAERTQAAAALALRTAKLVTSPLAMLREATHVGSALRTVAGAVLRAQEPNPFEGETGTGNRFLWWSAPFDQIKTIGKQLGGTVNDVALALLSDAISQISGNVTPAASVRVICPVDVSHRSSAVTLGNHVSGMLVDLPIGPQDPTSRWDAVLEATRKAKDSGAIEGTSLFGEFVNAVSPSLLRTLERRLGDAAPFDLIVTNVAGPKFPLYLFEHRMTEAYPLVPLFRGKSLAIALFSYADRLSWGFNVVASRLDCARKLRRALALSLQRYSLLAEPHVPERRHTPMHLPPQSRIVFPVASENERPSQQAEREGERMAPWEEGSWSFVRDLRNGVQ